MATYYIPGDYAGGTILVNEGDVFIFGSGAATDVAFESATGTATDFSIEFNESNANKFDVKVESDLTANIAVADDVSLEELKLDAGKSLSTDVTIGDNVTLKEFNGTDAGTDTVEIGDNFTTSMDLKTQGGDDTVTVGENYTGPKIDTGDGNDTVITSDPDANIEKAETILEPDGVVDGTGGDDLMGPGYSDGQTDTIDGDDGVDDTIVGGAGSDDISGGDGDDVIYGDYGRTARRALQPMPSWPTPRSTRAAPSRSTSITSPREIRSTSRSPTTRPRPSPPSMSDGPAPTRT